MSNDAISAIDVNTENQKWTAMGDGALSPPVTANGYTYVASSAGTLYVFDDKTGAITDMKTLPENFMDVGQNVSAPTSGLAIGGDLLLVPAGNHLVAY